MPLRNGRYALPSCGTHRAHAPPHTVAAQGLEVSSTTSLSTCFSSDSSATLERRLFPSHYFRGNDCLCKGLATRNPCGWTWHQWTVPTGFFSQRTKNAASRRQGIDPKNGKH
jgi:hypothetical protein